MAAKIVDLSNGKLSVNRTDFPTLSGCVLVILNNPRQAKVGDLAEQAV